MTDIVQRLTEDAADHVEVAKCCDCRPEDTVNWRHAENAKEAAAEITRLRAEADALRKDLVLVMDYPHVRKYIGSQVANVADSAIDATKGTT